MENEKNYDFRKRLLNIHVESARDKTAKIEDTELEISNGFTIVIAENAGRVVLTAAKDFQDYLFTSMGVSVLLQKGADKSNTQNNTIILSLQSETQTEILEANGYMGFHIQIDNGINVCGYDERGVAQALYYLEDKMSLRKAPFLKREVIEKKPLFSPRMVHSGYGLDNYPNEYLSAIAHSGMDAILVFVKDVNITPSGFLDFNELIYRAEAYGIDVYAYSYLVSHKHPDDNDAEKFYDNLYGKLFEHCSKLKGIVLVGESVEFPSKDKNVSKKFYYENTVDGIPTGKPSAGWWPCEDYPKWLEVVKSSIYKHKSDADIVFWTYNWGYAPQEDRLKLIENMPTDISLLVTFEMFEQYQVGNVNEFCCDYTLAFEGPGKYFSSEAEAAHKRGIRLYAMANTGGLTWDIGVIPYEPMPYQWIKRYKSLLKAHEQWGLCGLMESHHYGYWPSFVGELSKHAFLGEPMEHALQDILAKNYGSENVENVNEALKLWSEAIEHYIPTNEDQYGPFRIGPSYPLCLNRILSPITASHAMFGNKICKTEYKNMDNDYSSPFSIRIHQEIKSLSIMRDKMVKGTDILDSINNKNDNQELQLLINLGRFIYHCVQTTINVKNWSILKNQLNLEKTSEEVNSIAYKMEKLACEEIKNAEETIPLVEFDSRLGWEPSMEYIGDSAHIKWKIKQVKYMIEKELSLFKR